MDLHIHTKEDRADRTVVRGLDESNQMKNIKGIGHFFETLSVGSVPGTDYSQIYAFLMNTRFQAEMHLDRSTLAKKD